MTPAEVRALSAAEYLGFLSVMDQERRDREREASKLSKRRRR